MASSPQLGVLHHPLDLHLRTDIIVIARVVWPKVLGWLL